MISSLLQNAAQMKLSERWFEAVRDGRKKFEGRRDWSYAKTLVPGDVIKFSHYTNPEIPSFEKRVRSIRRFPTFRDALETLSIGDVLPGVSSVEDGVEIYLKYVSIETQLRDGVIMIELE